MLVRALLVATILLILNVNSIMAVFDGTPSTPQSFHSHPDYTNNLYSVKVHSRDSNTWSSLPSMDAQHGSNCSGPPASHNTNQYINAVYICNEHLMTAINSGDGYALIVVTPNKQLDLQNGGYVEFELSTQRMSTRDWWDVMITPMSEHLDLPLKSSLSEDVDLQGSPMNMYQINSDNGGPTLTAMRNGVPQYYNTGATVPQISSGVVEGTNQAAIRQRFRFTVDNGFMKFERLQSNTAPALVFWNIEVEPHFSLGIVQFGHHSYNPAKDGAGVAATWHWDEIKVQNNDSNSREFGIYHSTPRNITVNGSFSFPSAPSGAYAQFSAICGVRVNNITVAPQPSTRTHHPEVHSSYRIPVSQGATSLDISFEADDWYGPPSFPCQAKDLEIFYPIQQVATVTPTQTLTITPTLTTTPVNTLTPTSTPTPTATPLGVPLCAIVRWDGINAIFSSWVTCP